MIEASTGMIVASGGPPRVRVSGSHLQHYSPQARVVVGGTSVAGEGLIASHEIDTPPHVIRLAAPSSDDEYARALYAALREADRLGLAVVRVMAPDGEGLAIAIRDRITRSSAKG
jgi:L-threonylcarbamoyladenylate synthase